MANYNVQEIFKYQYDTNNNITRISNKSNVELAFYEYDGLNRMVRENRPFKGVINIFD